VPAAVPAAVARNRRLYGGLVAHVGVAVAIVGITASSAFARQTEVTLSPGQVVTFAGYTLRYQGQHDLRQPQRRVLVAVVDVARDGKALGQVHPSLNQYPGASDPIGTPSIKYGVLKDFYSSVIGFSSDGTQATFRFFLNPGVMWLWVGGAVIVLGGLLAAWPGRRGTVALEPPARRRELAVVS